MKSCKLCSSTYDDRVDFCFRDGTPLVLMAPAAPPPSAAGDAAPGGHKESAAADASDVTEVRARGKGKGLRLGRPTVDDMLAVPEPGFLRRDPMDAPTPTVPPWRQQGAPDLGPHPDEDTVPVMAPVDADADLDIEPTSDEVLPTVTMLPDRGAAPDVGVAAAANSGRAAPAAAATPSPTTADLLGAVTEELPIGPPVVDPVTDEDLSGPTPIAEPEVDRDAINDIAMALGSAPRATAPSPATAAPVPAPAALADDIDFPAVPPADDDPFAGYSDPPDERPRRMGLGLGLALFGGAGFLVLAALILAFFLIPDKGDATAAAAAAAAATAAADADPVPEPVAAVVEPEPEPEPEPVVEPEPEPVAAPVATAPVAAAPVAAAGRPATPTTTTTTTTTAGTATRPATTTTTTTAAAPATAKTTTTATADASAPATDPWGATASASKGNISVSSDPTGAMVFVDNRQVGRSPIKHEVPYGSHTIRLQLAGYKTDARTVDVSGPELAVPFELRPIVVTGQVNIFGANGATVYVDGNAVGNIPATANISEGLHTFKVVQSDGTEFTESREIRFQVPGKPVTVDLTRR